jgi:DNA-binding LacI/PurR family transcriptional regulator
MALGAVRQARQQGLAVPEDVSVVGFDDSVFLTFFDPPLTTIRQPVQEMAAAAVTALIDAIDGAAVRSREYLYAPDLVVRGSTARRRVS